MIWRTCTKKNPPLGERRTIVRFAWLPTKLEAGYFDERHNEWRYWVWLEKYQVDQLYYPHFNTISGWKDHWTYLHETKHNPT